MFWGKGQRTRLSSPPQQCDPEQLKGLLGTKDESTEMHGTALGCIPLLIMSCLYGHAEMGGPAPQKASVDNGCTPLIKATLNSHDKVVSVLVKYRADASLKDDDNKTALDVAMEKGLQRPKTPPSWPLLHSRR